MVTATACLPRKRGRFVGSSGPGGPEVRPANVAPSSASKYPRRAVHPCQMAWNRAGIAPKQALYPREEMSVGRALQKMGAVELEEVSPGALRISRCSQAPELKALRDRVRNAATGRARELVLDVGVTRPDRINEPPQRCHEALLADAMDHEYCLLAGHSSSTGAAGTAGRASRRPRMHHETDGHSRARCHSPPSSVLVISFGMKAHDTVVIGSLEGIRAAKAAGVRATGFAAMTPAGCLRAAEAEADAIGRSLAEASLLT